MKIEIKSRFTGEVLFTHEAEKNSVKITLIAAISAGPDLLGADLRGANLYCADLRGANLYCANLYGANLYGADLYGADLYGEKLLKTPLFILNLDWHVTITTSHMKIGCQLHLISEWRSFNDDEISEMSSRALEFWNKYKSVLLSMCEAHQQEDL